MDKDLSDSDCQTSRENDNEQSLVGKLKKNVTEIISNTPLSKWFRKQNDTPTASVRRRQDDSDEEGDFHEFQPPAKRTKLPSTRETLSLNVSETLSPISTVNHMKKPIYKHFPEPIAGPSGYQTRKLLSDSEESSGYSSGRIGSKEIVSQESSKQTSPMENSPRKARSLFQNSSTGHTFLSERSLSPNRNSSLSSRTPSFNPSSFGSSSFVDRTLLTKRILKSPFYNGHTVYGGAAAYGRNSKRAPQDMRKVLRQSVSIKPVNSSIEKGDLQLGKTARRILDTLEQYSSPISDAKKIPVASKRFRSDGPLTPYIGANPYSVRGPRHTSNKELQVPSVTDLLKMKIDQQKTRLQDSTEAVRQIATKSKSVLNKTTYEIPVQKESDRHTGKMKTKITSVRKRAQVDEVVPEVKLNPVSLPIKELPKFDIVVPPPSEKPLTTSSTSNIFTNQTKPSPLVSKPIEPTFTMTKPVESLIDTKLKETSKSSSEDQMEFKFSAPLVLAEYLKPLKALNNFKFSEPLVKKRRSIHAELDNQENKPVDGGKKTKKNNGENSSSMFGTGGENKDTSSASLMEKFKPKEGTWECTVCMIRNQADKTKCAACETPRKSGGQNGNKTEPSSIFETPAKPVNTPFLLADKFKTPSNTWECPTCMIRNKEDLQKCAACETKKPASNGSSKSQQPMLAFGDKFKAPSDTWECSTCMVRNKNDVAKCVACETQKPGSVAAAVSSSGPPLTGASFGTQFTPPASTWECSVCMIRNKEELVKCAACESPKPGAKNVVTTSYFGDDFKKKDSEWECEVCMVRNKSTLTKCQCCESLKPGSSLSTSSSNTETTKVSSFNFGIDKNTASSFTFGIPSSVQSSDAPKTNAGLIFGENRQEAGKKSETPTFSFGIPVTAKSDTKDSTEAKKDTPKTSEEPSKATPTFTFGTPSTSAGAKPSNSTPTFSFGAPGTSATSKSSNSTPTFSFGAPKTDGGVKLTMPAPTSTVAVANNIEDKSNKGDSKKEEEKKVNPLLKPSEKLPEKASVAPSGFSFGLSKGTVSPSVSSSTSIRPFESSNTDDSPSKRSKSASEPADAKSKPMFVGMPMPSSDLFSGKKPVGFGAPASVTAPAATASGVIPAFGSTISQADSSKSAPMFKFGSSSSDAPKQTNGFSFGSSSSPFGAKESTANSATKPFSFATPTPAAPAAPASSGTNPAPAFGKTTPRFSFGATPPKAPTFSFGQSSVPPSFSFGSNNNSKPDSSFGASPAPNPFSATNSKPETIFGAAPSQNSVPNGMFNFGSAAATNQKAGFSFGASSGSTDTAGAPPSQGGFNFGASNTTVSAGSGGFSFSAATPSFDANVKPSFNFTGGAGITAFSAPPAQDGAMPPRKIKKAVRRTVR